VSRSRGPSAAAGAWAKNDRHRRWVALTVLALLAAITAGLAFASFAGARRTHTAFSRLRSQTHAADAIVFASQVGKAHPDWSKLAARPEVATLARWYLAFGRSPDDGGETVLFGSVGDAWGTAIDRPIIERGRMYSPHASDEMVIDEETAKYEHVTVGSVLPFHAFGARQDDTSGQPPNGARIPLRVVGIVRTTQQFLFTPLVMLAPGVLAAHRGDMLWLENAFVRVRGGAAGIAALQRDANSLIAPGTPVLDLHQAQRRVNTSLNVEQTALLLLGLAIAAAGMVLVGQVLGRSASTIGRDAPVLRAVGMTRRDLASAGARAHLFAALGAAVGAVAVAVIASHWFPIGLAARVDPHHGLAADWVVLAPGAVLVAGLLFSGAYVLSARAARTVRSDGRAAGPIVEWIRRDTPVSVGVGATMAFDRQRRRADVAILPAVIGAIVGVLGVAGALTLDAGLRDALAHPARAGVTWDATVEPARSQYAARGLSPALLARVAAVPGVRSAASVDRLVIDVNGVGVPGFTVRTPSSAANPITLTTIAGRPPEGPNEAAIGPASARDLHVAIGDVVTVGDAHTRVTITGRALFPSDVHATFDEGIWLPPAAWDAVVPPNKQGDATSPDSVVAVRFAASTNHAQAIARIATALGPRALAVAPADVPDELANLKNVERLPRVLAAFLAFLAIAALAYLLIAITRARARDFAIMRALGFTRRQSRTVMAAQSTAIALVGLAVGVPLGVLLGRVAWRLVTARVPLQNVTPEAVVAVIAIVPVALIAANLVAVWPARRVARLRAAEVLRAE
jgi:hypothetical protein